LTSSLTSNGSLIIKTNKQTNTHKKEKSKLNISTQKLARLSGGSYISSISYPFFWWLNCLVKKKKKKISWMHHIFAVPVQWIILSSGYSTSWECNSVGDTARRG